MTVRPMNAKALGHVGFFIRGIQFRALLCVKAQKVTRNGIESRALMRRRYAAVALTPPCYGRANGIHRSARRPDPRRALRSRPDRSRSSASQARDGTRTVSAP